MRNSEYDRQTAPYRKRTKSSKIHADKYVAQRIMRKSVEGLSRKGRALKAIQDPELRDADLASTIAAIGRLSERTAAEPLADVFSRQAADLQERANATSNTFPDLAAGFERRAKNLRTSETRLRNR